MPNIMIHEKVGDYISKKENKNSYDFYLGLLAPDTPNLEGFAPKEERWEAHQRRADYKEWREALYNFYEQEKNHYSKDFIDGYCIHILTDIVYDDFFYLKVRDVIEETYSREESHTIMRNDMEKYYFAGIEEIKKVLESSNNSYDILNISKEKLTKWKEKEISLWKPPKESIYLTDELIHVLEEQVYKEWKEKVGE